MTDTDAKETIGREIARLLHEIEKDAIPDRLVSLALELQRALAERQVKATQP